MAKESAKTAEGFGVEVLKAADPAPAEAAAEVLFVFKGNGLRSYRSPDGLYVRDFTGSEPPYSCTRQEWDDYLSKEGCFERA